MLYKNANTAWKRVSEGTRRSVVFNDDCIELLKAVPDKSTSLVVTSPPYCMGKEYEPGNTIDDFVRAHELVLPEVARLVEDGGSVCWQTGYHVRKNELMPLDYLVLDIVRRLKLPLTLRNRVVWHFGHGLHPPRRFSGRHEVIMWFTKGDDYHFDLDAIRVPQKYPGKKASRGPNAGEYSGNPLGKNPSDVWDIPNVKANHCEKLDHPCQYPVALVRRLVCALTRPDDIVLDPFCGVGSTGVAALLEGRRFIGAELMPEYAVQAVERLTETLRGEVAVRPDEQVAIPSERSAVARRPDSWPSLVPAGRLG